MAFGISARAAQRAVKTARRNGIKAGLFRPITLWPFPEAPFLDIASKARSIIVAEMNAGQLSLEIERLCGGADRIARINRIDGLGLTESTVYPMLARLAREGTLEVRAVASPSGPPRRYYRLTAAGRRRLGEMIGHWRDVQAGLDVLLRGSES